MNKEEIKNILISMRTPENELAMNFLLGKIDMMDQGDIEKGLSKIGSSEENIRDFVHREIQKRQVKITKKHTPINDMFTYGVTGDSVHLHLPDRLDTMLNSIGFLKTFDTVNLNLLDAINRIKNLKDNGFYKFSETDKIYMISPILLKSELKFLESMDFTINLYKQKDLRDEQFVKEHLEVRLGIADF